MIFKDKTKALLNLKNKVNIISQAFAFQLSFKIRKSILELKLLIILF